MARISATNIMEDLKLQPHQKRVVDEKNELQEKISKLSDFVTVNKVFKSLAEVEKTDLRDQLSFMCLYLEKLESRIARF